MSTGGKIVKAGCAWTCLTPFLLCGAFALAVHYDLGKKTPEEQETPPRAPEEASAPVSSLSPENQRALELLREAKRKRRG